ncbi:hypothetical protein A1O1_08319 [Capronia coronata CBS 617.96]|uniref:Mitochondrial resolvase Ydc2 catalytic domain-containing protein n=1 Tax=Capronia coronata CBS 617.96 TaxID=1182541 RepID=W9XI25_9EURO|nr:uncharacterized protein A1O1_08319 [Capronia coronata CBS 617.96]EXJ80177.1 hypothetical protein A1O1_08319 [Capronia coronata CBS 617.96]
MSPAPSWLAGLSLARLHRIAVSIGSPCSGTKAERVAGIQHALSGVETSRRENLSLLSIDMGIRNLAFAHISAPRHVDKRLLYGLPTLRQWRQVAVSQASEVEAIDSHLMAPGESKLEGASPVTHIRSRLGKESFEPIDYALHAYNLVTNLLRTYKPSHVLIERQRFRSGGRAAVPEWTIRVGVFEGMLYAVLRTLVEEGKVQVQVEPMQPTFVNRYWLESREAAKSAPVKTPAVRRSGRDVKRAKIDRVGQMLVDDEKPPAIRLDEDLRPFTSEFVSIWQKDRKRNVLATNMNGISKLDDLADCLLQGLAWIDWQNARRRIHVLGPDGVEEDSGELL